MVCTRDRRASQRCSAPGGRNATAVFAPLLVDRTSVTDTQTNGVTALTAGKKHLRAEGNVELQRAVNAYRQSEDNAPCILNTDTGWSWMIMYMLRPFYLRERTPRNPTDGDWLRSTKCMDVVGNININTKIKKKSVSKEMSAPLQGIQTYTEPIQTMLRARTIHTDL